MDKVKEWTVEIFIDEHDGQTRARVRLHTDDNTVTGLGYARRNPKDTDVPEIGDELAAARALSDLAHKLFDTTVADIEQVTGHPATV